MSKQRKTDEDTLLEQLAAQVNAMTDLVLKIKAAGLQEKAERRLRSLTDDNDRAMAALEMTGYERIRVTAAERRYWICAQNLIEPVSGVILGSSC